MTETKAPPYPGKSADLVPLGDGLNFSAPLAQVSGTLVSNPLFFVRSNNPLPALDASTWRLRVDGRVKRSLTLDLDGLRARPAISHEVWVECAGNSRVRMEPATEGNQWDDQAVSNARFRGVSLATILDEAGVEDDAIEMIASGHDVDGAGTPFQRSLPIDIARQAEVLLAYEMNGEPIPAPNGGPVRLLVPRWAGIASVKWPARLELVNTPFQGYYNAQRYIVVDADGRTTGSVREMPVKSVIAWPAEGEQLAAAACTLRGFAWSGRAPIERVEVSIDNQRTWSPARLIRGDGPLAWTRWEYAWNPRSTGPVTLAVRAADTAGNVQPERATWNRFGYHMNAIVTRSVTVA
ncbi:MAG TPA: sulfite oxidase [Chloroflexota bacterium]